VRCKHAGSGDGAGKLGAGPLGEGRAASAGLGRLRAPGATFFGGGGGGGRGAFGDAREVSCQCARRGVWDWEGASVRAMRGGARPRARVARGMGGGEGVASGGARDRAAP